MFSIKALSIAFSLTQGINRKIKVLKRACYGFTNQKFFFLRIDCLFA
nr:transposase [Limosilactobacillus antri]